MVAQMPNAHRRFLLGFEQGEPDWTLLGVKGAADLPAVKWGALNLAKLPTNCRADLINQLEAVFSEK
jgi:hypothetical protein